MENEAKSIARLLSARYSVKEIAKWNQMYDYLQKQNEISEKQPKEVRSISNLSNSAIILSNILTKKDNSKEFFVNPHYFSKEPVIPKDRQRWFVVLIGGMSDVELSEFRNVSNLCRPNDEFIFMTTKLTSPNNFMKELLE